jgi:hypothetical protein
VVYAGKIDDGVDKISLLRPAVHEVGISDLYRARETVVGRDRLRTLGCLLIIWWGERLRLHDKNGIRQKRRQDRTTHLFHVRP